MVRPEILEGLEDDTELQERLDELNIRRFGQIAIQAWIENNGSMTVQWALRYLDDIDASPDATAENIINSGPVEDMSTRAFALTYAENKEIFEQAFAFRKDLCEGLITDYLAAISDAAKALARYNQLYGLNDKTDECTVELVETLEEYTRQVEIVKTTDIRIVELAKARITGNETNE